MFQSTCRRSSPRVRRKSSNPTPALDVERRSPEEPASTFRECRSRRSRRRQPRRQQPSIDAASRCPVRPARPSVPSWSPSRVLRGLPSAYSQIVTFTFLAPLPRSVSGRGRAGRPDRRAVRPAPPARVVSRNGDHRPVRQHPGVRRDQANAFVSTECSVAVSPSAGPARARVRRVARHGHRRDRRTDRTTAKPPRRRGGNLSRRCRARLRRRPPPASPLEPPRPPPPGDEVLGSEHRNPASTAHTTRRWPGSAQPAFGEHRRERHAQRRRPTPRRPPPGVPPPDAPTPEER